MNLFSFGVELCCLHRSEIRLHEQKNLGECLGFARDARGLSASFKWFITLNFLQSRCISTKDKHSVAYSISRDAFITRLRCFPVNGPHWGEANRIPSSNQSIVSHSRADQVPTIIFMIMIINIHNHHLEKNWKSPM